MSFSLSARLLIEMPQVTVGAAAAGDFDRLDRFRHRDHRSVVFAARQFGDAQVALERDELGFLRNAAKAEPAGEQPLVHDAGGAEIFVAGLAGNHRAEFARIGHYAAQHLCVVHA
jgi:hypothetical protein